MSRKDKIKWVLVFVITGVVAALLAVLTAFVLYRLTR